MFYTIYLFIFWLNFFYKSLSLSLNVFGWMSGYKKNGWWRTRGENQDFLGFFRATINYMPHINTFFLVKPTQTPTRTQVLLSLCLTRIWCVLFKTWRYKTPRQKRMTTNTPTVVLHENSPPCTCCSSVVCSRDISDNDEQEDVQGTTTDMTLMTSNIPCLILKLILFVPLCLCRAFHKYSTQGSCLRTDEIHRVVMTHINLIKPNIHVIVIVHTHRNQARRTKRSVEYFQLVRSSDFRRTTLMISLQIHRRERFQKFSKKSSKTFQDLFERERERERIVS